MLCVSMNNCDNDNVVYLYNEMNLLHIIPERLTLK